jgi:hypothetical protein
MYEVRCNVCSQYICRKLDCHVVSVQSAAYADVKLIWIGRHRNTNIVTSSHPWQILKVSNQLSHLVMFDNNESVCPLRPSVCALILVSLFGSERFDTCRTLKFREAESFLTGCEILTAVVMKSSVFWGIRLHSPDFTTLYSQKIKLFLLVKLSVKISPLLWDPKFN